MLNNQKGVGMALTIMSIVLISIAGLALLIRSVTLSQIVTHKNYSITSVEAAKAGIAEAIYNVQYIMTPNPTPNPTPVTIIANKPLTYPGSSVTNQEEKGYYMVQMIDNLNGKSSVTSSQGYTIPSHAAGLLSTGTVGNPPQKTARVFVIVPSKIEPGFYPFDYAAFGKDQFNGGSLGDKDYNNFITDSYNSSLGQSEDTHGPKGDVGTNGNIVNLKGTINGTVYYTNGHEPGEENISAKQMLDKPVVFPTIAMPTLPAGNIPPWVGNGADNKGTLVPPDKDYSGMDFKISNTYKLTSGTYIFNDVDINNTTLNVDTSGGPVKIYIKGDLQITGQGICNESTPGNLNIYGTGSNEAWSINGNATLRAAIYAPNTSISLQGSGTKGTVCGSVVGKTVELSGSITIHYDEALQELGGATPDYSKLNITKLKWIWME